MDAVCRWPERVFRIETRSTFPAEGRCDECAGSGSPGGSQAQPCPIHAISHPSVSDERRARTARARDDARRRPGPAGRRQRVRAAELHPSEPLRPIALAIARRRTLSVRLATNTLHAIVNGRVVRSSLTAVTNGVPCYDVALALEEPVDWSRDAVFGGTVRPGGRSGSGLGPRPRRGDARHRSGSRSHLRGEAEGGVSRHVAQSATRRSTTTLPTR